VNGFKLNELPVGPEWVLVFDKCINSSEALSGAATHLLSYQTRSNIVIFAEYREAPRRTAEIGTPISLIGLRKSCRDTMSTERMNSIFDIITFLLDAADEEFLWNACELGAPAEVPLTGYSPASMAAIIPHRGRIDFLRTCLKAMINQGLSSCNVVIDEERGIQYRELIKHFDQVAFFAINTVPLGPYVCRQLAVEKIASDFVIFNDSDDISSVNRVTSLNAEMGRAGYEMCGSYELRVDYVSRTVVPVRYPLDVNDALTRGPAFAQLLPTVVINRSSFFATGGFSTNRKIASDTQFLLRAGLRIRIGNCPRFLYLRRSHANSLTKGVFCPLGDPERHDLDFEWKTSYIAVRNRVTNIDSSSLAPIPHPDWARLQLLRVS
jgi:hypothetical protein